MRPLAEEIDDKTEEGHAVVAQNAIDEYHGGRIHLRHAEKIIMPARPASTRPSPPGVKGTVVSTAVPRAKNNMGASGMLEMLLVCKLSDRKRAAVSSLRETTLRW